MEGTTTAAALALVFASTLVSPLAQAGPVTDALNSIDAVCGNPVVHLGDEQVGSLSPHACDDYNGTIVLPILQVHPCDPNAPGVYRTLGQVLYDKAGCSSSANQTAHAAPGAALADVDAVCGNRLFQLVDRGMSGFSPHFCDYEYNSEGGSQPGRGGLYVPLIQQHLCDPGSAGIYRNVGQALSTTAPCSTTLNETAHETLE